MTEAMAIELGRDAVVMILILSGPALFFALLVGLCISIIQAATQINEPTLSFVPKIVSVFLTVIVLGPWMLSRLTAYAGWLLGNLAGFAR